MCFAGEKSLSVVLELIRNTDIFIDFYYYCF